MTRTTEKTAQFSISYTFSTHSVWFETPPYRHTAVGPDERVRLPLLVIRNDLGVVRRVAAQARDHVRLSCPVTHRRDPLDNHFSELGLFVHDRAVQVVSN